MASPASTNAIADDIFNVPSRPVYKQMVVRFCFWTCESVLHLESMRSHLKIDFHTLNCIIDTCLNVNKRVVSDCYYVIE